MDRLETLLTDTFTEHADDAPTGPVPLPDTRRRNKTGLAVMSGIAAAVTAAVVALTVGGLISSNAPEPQRHANRPTPSITPVLGTQRLAAYGPISLRVPDALPTRTSLCGAQVANEVIAMTTAALTVACPRAATGLAAKPGTVVWFSAPNQATPYDTIATTTAQIQGHAARRGYAHDTKHLGAGVSAVVRLTSSGVSVGVTAPTRTQVDALLSTMRVTAVNPDGCASTSTAAGTTDTRPSRHLVRPGARTAVRCEYDSDTGLLVNTDAYAAAAAATLTTALNALKPDPCHCVHGGTTALSQLEVVYFVYPGNPTTRVTGHIGSNFDSWTNGTRTVANFSSTIVALLDNLANH